MSRRRAAFLQRAVATDVEWVELSLLDQFDAVAVGKVDAAICRLPLSHDGLVQCAVLLEEKKKLVVAAGHRL
jgi:DNA-binding transcriptional LysR family regulator